MANTMLSELQQYILALAELHRINNWRDTGEHPDVYSYEVLATRYGVRTQDGTRLLLWQERIDTRPLLAKGRYGIRYQAARVAVSKAVRRLEQRGLVHRAYFLDAEGRKSLGITVQPKGYHRASQALKRFAPHWEKTYQAWRAREMALNRDHVPDHTNQQ